MKTITIVLTVIVATLGLQAQTTHDLNWQVGIGTNVDLTIDVGDIVRWTWTDGLPHTVESTSGSTETFNSGTITGNGSTYSYQFNVVGTNPYLCGIHPSTMRGTITVQEPLSNDEFTLKDVSITPNPASTQLALNLPDGISIDSILIFDLIGKQIYSSNTFKHTIDISNLTKGMYLLKISSKNLVHTKRFIKQ